MRKAKANEIPVVVVEATPLFQTTLRQKITPYLPPPMVVAMRKIDPQLEPYVGPEPSMTILGTICLGLFLWQLLIRSCGCGRGGAGGGGKAIQNDEDDDEDNLLLKQESRYFDATILLCGPSLAGKTTLFYTLVHPNTNNNNNTTKTNTTVKSIKPNTGFVVQQNNGKIWRYLDAPGHWGASKLRSTILLDDKKESSVQKIILVLDATQPVGKAADYLYAICNQQQQQHNSKNHHKTTKLLVACHKAHAPKAKNVRRLKLQLRAELERLEKLELKNNNNSSGEQETDWEQVLEQVEFCASSCDDPPMLEGIHRFCQA
jgi:signal recognition particle receptor subunit beta